MPKVKIHSGASKRFKKTAGGYKYRHAFRNHILTKKAPKRKRQLRRPARLNASDAGLVARMLRN
ncbi:MAG: 50S ribosomal protein L35 [Porticoccaceae bacterium]|nr:MAG: 50S ribosomal protein L35 [Porticoccaceae bacterium]